MASINNWHKKKLSFFKLQQASSLSGRELEANKSYLFCQSMAPCKIWKPYLFLLSSLQSPESYTRDASNTPLLMQGKAWNCLNKNFTPIFEANLFQQQINWQQVNWLFFEKLKWVENALFVFKRFNNFNHHSKENLTSTCKI